MSLAAQGQFDEDAVDDDDLDDVDDDEEFYKEVAKEQEDLVERRAKALKKSTIGSLIIDRILPKQVEAKVRQLSRAKQVSLS